MKLIVILYFLQNFLEKKNFEAKKIRKRSLCHRVSLVKVVRGIYMMIYEAQIQNLTSDQGQVNTLTLPK